MGLACGWFFSAGRYENSTEGRTFTQTGIGYDFGLDNKRYELKGTFTSAVAGVNAWRFPNLRGQVLWLPDRLEITDTTTELYGGRARFNYRMAPMGRKGVPTKATWDVQYRDVDLARLRREGVAPAGVQWQDDRQAA